MPEMTAIIAFAMIALGLVLTPGPNMVYLISRSINQGRAAGMISLAGVVAGFLFYMLCAVFGITVLLLAVPYAYETLKFAGALYLLYLAWQAVKPNGKSPFEVKTLPQDSPYKLFMMGFITNLLNPKIAIMYITLLPQFLDPKAGSMLTQSLFLGMTQIIISVLVNGMIVISASHIAKFLSGQPVMMRIQKWLMGTVLAGFAISIMAQAKR